MNVSILKYYEYAVFKNQLAKGDELQLLRLFANICFRAGIRPIFLMDHCYDRFSFSREFLINEVFAVHDEFKAQLDKVDSQLQELPLFPNSVYQSLPKVLAEGCRVFSSSREKDAFLLAALSVASSFFPNAEGHFRGRKYYGNLFSFFISPLSMNIDALDHAFRLSEKYEDEIWKKSMVTLVEQTKSAVLATEEDSTTYSTVKAMMNKIMNVPRPMLHMNELVSEEGLLGYFKQEINQRGLLFKQLKGFGESLNTNWPRLISQFKKAFDHEVLTGKVFGELVEVKSPKLSLVMSGGLKSLIQMIPVVENGMYSRFCFYACADIPKSDHHGMVEIIFSMLSYRLNEMLEKHEGKVFKFKLSLSQMSCLEESFKATLNKIRMEYGKDLLPLVKRNTIHQFRLAMVLSLLFNLERELWVEEVECEDEIFFMAQSMAEVLLEHALALYPLFKNS